MNVRHLRISPKDDSILLNTHCTSHNAILPVFARSTSSRVASTTPLPPTVPLSRVEVALVAKTSVSSSKSIHKQCSYVGILFSIVLNPIDPSTFPRTDFIIESLLLKYVAIRYVISISPLRASLFKRMILRRSISTSNIDMSAFLLAK